MSNLTCKKCQTPLASHVIICPECGHSTYELELNFLTLDEKEEITKHLVTSNQHNPNDDSNLKIAPSFITQSDSASIDSTPSKHHDKMSLEGHTTSIDLILPWKNEYNLGIEVIDNQHKHIVILINKIFYTLKTAKRNESFIKEIVLRLSNYSKEHFKYEEKLFFACKYPNLKTHQASHKIFIEKAMKINTEFQKGIINPREILNFLMNWFLQHTQTLDKDFVSFLEDQKNSDK